MWRNPIVIVLEIVFVIVLLRLIGCGGQESQRPAPLEHKPTIEPIDKKPVVNGEEAQEESRSERVRREYAKKGLCPSAEWPAKTDERAYFLKRFGNPTKSGGSEKLRWLRYDDEKLYVQFAFIADGAWQLFTISSTRATDPDDLSADEIYRRLESRDTMKKKK